MKYSLKKYIFWVFTLLIFLGTYSMAHIRVCAKEDPVSEAKKSVIEIYAGINDKTGEFQKIKHGSGVVISSQDNMSYILTSYKFLHISEDQIKKFCKEHDVETDEYSSTSSIVVKAVVKGDVLVDTTTITDSQDKNFSVLQIDNSMSEKVPLAIGDSDELVIGSKVYSLGFAEDAGDDDEAKNRNTQFTYEDVVISEGNITDTMSNKNGVYYLQHTANVDQGNKGGPLIDEDGYIVGINDSSVSDQDNSYSISINDIAEILDNFKLDYESKAKNLSLASLAEKITECKKLLNSGLYKSNSTETLQTAIEEAESLQEAGDENLDAVQTVMNDMDAGKQALVLKMKTSRKIVIVFGIVDLMALLLLFKYILDKHKLQKAIDFTGSGSTYMDDTSSGEGESFDIAEDIDTVSNGAKQVAQSGQSESISPSESPLDKALSSTLNDDNEAGKEDSTLILTELNPTKSFRPKAAITVLRTGNTVNISKPSFNIGKNPELTDYAILGNPAVSRFHATIIWDGSHYYISDRGSSNGTYVNGETVGKNQRYILKDDDHVLLANEECVFHISQSGEH